MLSKSVEWEIVIRIKSIFYNNFVDINWKKNVKNVVDKNAN